MFSFLFKTWFHLCYVGIFIFGTVKILKNTEKTWLHLRQFLWKKRHRWSHVFFNSGSVKKFQKSWLHRWSHDFLQFCLVSSLKNMASSFFIDLRCSHVLTVSCLGKLLKTHGFIDEAIFFKNLSSQNFQKRWLHLKFVETKTVLVKKKNTVEGYTSLFVLLLVLRSSPFFRRLSILRVTIPRDCLRWVLFRLFHFLR